MRKLPLLFLTMLICIMVFNPISNVQAAALNVTDITDKYRGDQVTISGTSPFTEVIAKVYDPNNVILYIEVLSVLDNGNYSKTFSLSNDAIYGTYKVVVGQETNVVNDTFNVIARPSVGGGGGGGGAPSQGTQITVPVQSGTTGTTVSQTTIQRTAGSNGTVKDSVVMTEQSAKETIAALKNQGEKTARIVIPDAEDKVSEVNVSIPKIALTAIKSGGIDLEIKTENAKLTIPNTTLEKFNQDLYFRVVPIKGQQEKDQIAERAKQEQIVQDVVQGRDIQVLGRPAEIETNLQSQPVTITMPIREEDLPKDKESRQRILDDLVIFIEHSDGTKEVIKGTFITNEDGTLGIEFGIDKFSTFTLVYVEGSKEYFAQLEKDKKVEGTVHKAYISGYPDGTFKPANSISRAEMASLLSRVYDGELKENTSPTSYVDIPAGHWAMTSIEKAQLTGLMRGYSDHTFGPNKSITRAEMAAIVSRWLKLEGTGSSSAKDIQGHWAEQAIMLVDKANIMNGMPDGTFQPNKPLSRAEAVTIVNRILKRGPLYGDVKPTFIDVPTTHWAYKEIEEASKDHKYSIDESGKETVLIK
ncbi:S-layer homology domain-containing protein [Schinkia azotoformans]|uniref:Cell surface glycoprotein 2 n=1 Tax=Schinkia azotoformans LMG 9581 TaxID=1131731 RepID=K6C6R9_SCHAZ|nr:S-layer homology domain-containing protein [Schinkia azotoformans]EKN66845.1 cell surface glycoprotein 2 [Schinkia azotoformans LMG 9581]MEC1639558.1 S-layer homology domain-containing protein [Schinkia azotoformans]MED4414630.1 S-layer homology domain-containing protein [Schinkia azotoformans]